MSANPHSGLPLDRMRDWMRDVLTAAGAGRKQAEVTAECLAAAHRRGVDTHGALILRLYLPRLRSGAMDGTARPEVVQRSGAAALVDGRNALGPVVAAFATDLACELADAAGVGAVAVRRSNHFGAASVYADRAAARGCVGIVVSNSDPGMAPAGALGPVLGTNPIAIAGPAAGSDEAAPSLDIATSQAALGKVRVAAREGRAIPPGWASAPDGSPTTDAQLALAGSMTPLGGHKGFALAAMVDVLSACLSGAAISPDVVGDPASDQPQGTGHMFIALSIAHFGGEDIYRTRLADLTRRIHGAPRAAGIDGFLLPGEPEHATATRRGGVVPLDEASRNLLRDLGNEYGVPYPEVVS